MFLFFVSNSITINTNVFSSYIATLTLREIIQFLKLEKGFKKQKYIKNSQSLNKSDESNLNNSGMDISMKNSSKKKKRKSISRNKKNKKNNKKKSFKKPENKGEVINTSLNDSIYDTFSKMGINSGSKGKEKNSKGPNNSENIDEPSEPKNTDNIAKTEENDNNNKIEEKKNQKENKEFPKTGQTRAIYIALGMVILISAAGVVVIRIKNKKN